jgi:hypothetical protein
MEDALEAWFFADNRHHSRRVDDHAPSSPKPRICSRSALDTGLPSRSGGTRRRTAMPIR